LCQTGRGAFRDTNRHPLLASEHHQQQQPQEQQPGQLDRGAGEHQRRLPWRVHLEVSRQREGAPVHPAHHVSGGQPPSIASAGPADWPLAGGLAAGVIADALVGDPRRGHPVALFGHAATLIERSVYADTKARGAVFAACCEALAIGPVLAAARISRRRPLARPHRRFLHWSPEDRRLRRWRPLCLQS